MKIIELVFRYSSMILLILFFVLMAIFYGKLLFARTRVGKATVVRKECYEKQTVSKHPTAFSDTIYEVVFLCEGKELLFRVSPISYPNYRVGEKGMLKWKGSKLLDFS